MTVAKEDTLAAKAEGRENESLLRKILEYAVRAPSGHNTQPWLFRLAGQNSIDLLADRTRALAVVDPCDRELTISCGAALDHLEVAARHYGRALRIVLNPSPSDADLLARIVLLNDEPGDLSGIFAAIPLRRTTRSKFDDRTLPRPLAEQCQAIARSYGIALDLITDDDKRLAIAELVSAGDQLQFADPAFRRELASWVHSRRRVSRDGMSAESFGMPDVLSAVGALVIRTFDIGKGVAAGDREKLVAGSPTVAVFSSEDDSCSSWIQTGRALSRVLLKLAESGVTASYMNAPIERAELRPRLRDLVRPDAAPQLLLRFGYSPLPEPTVRRAVEEVIVQQSVGR